MARISDEELGRLKQEISLERMVEARGVVLRKRGDELIGLCPFHDDHSPSLVVNPSKNLWHCLGACQIGGTVIDWVMKAEEVSFRHAVEKLRTEFSPLAATSAVSQQVSNIAPHTELKRMVSQDADDQQCLRQVLSYYTETLKESPEAMAYLQKRGINSAEAVELFRLGYANRTLGYHIPPKTTPEGAALRSRLQEIGIYRDSGHEHFSGSLVIPVTDENGIVHEVYGRKTGEHLRKGTPKHLYLPGPHRGVWNVSALKASKEIILCESLVDALTFWCAGYRNVTASYGINGFTEDHLEAFKRYGIERVLIAYDRDEAGEKAASSLAADLMAQGIECFRIQFPKGMDANEYATSVKPAEKSLGLVIRQALWLGKGEAPEVTSQAMPLGPPEDENDSSVGAVPLCPPSQPSRIDAEIKKGEVTIPLGDRKWRIRGMEKNMSVDQLRVNVLCAIGDAFHVDIFDLYSARHRQSYIKQTTEELGVNEEVIKKDLGKVLLKLEDLQEAQIKQTLEPKKEAATLSDKETAEAMALLQDPGLLDRILADFEKCGIVGEETNKLAGYLAAVSRKLEEPLAIVIQSSSAAGKSSLMDAILSFFPPEERVQYSAMTGQSLFYMGEADLRHKILAIAEEEGAEKATYALKLLQSEGELTIASTGKDPTTGRLETQEYRVEGPVMIFLTTTAIEIDEELLNRCIVLTVDEEREQTRAIHRLQRERQTLEGLLARQDREQLRKVHQDAQRLLHPLLVANPFAERLTFMDDRTRTRRDHMKYLTLIRSIALLHQHQRPIKKVAHQGTQVAYIEVTLEDIETANHLAHQVLGRSLDELTPQTRRLLMALDEMVSKKCTKLGMDREDYRFTRREAREHTGLGNTQLKIHMHRLEELEYLLVHRGGRGQQFVYELAYNGEGKNGETFMSGLLDVKKLGKYDENRSGVNDDLSGTGRPQVGPKSGGCRGDNRPLSSNDSKDVTPLNGKKPKIAYQEEEKIVPYIESHTDITADSGT